MDVALAGAVPMWLVELAPKGYDYWEKRRSVCSQAVAEKGDVLMYGSKKPGAAGEVFNRLAEGIALLCLITKGPVPFNKRVFYHDRPSELFETEAEANERVWPKVPDMQSADHGTPQSQALQAMRETAGEEAGVEADTGAASGSSKTGGDADAT
jgi:hypothetical protein